MPETQVSDTTSVLSRDAVIILLALEEYQTEFNFVKEDFKVKIPQLSEILEDLKLMSFVYKAAVSKTLRLTKAGSDYAKHLKSIFPEGDIQQQQLSKSIFSGLLEIECADCGISGHVSIDSENGKLLLWDSHKKPSELKSSDSSNIKTDKIPFLESSKKKPKVEGLYAYRKKGRSKKTEIVSVVLFNGELSVEKNLYYDDEGEMLVFYNHTPVSDIKGHWTGPLENLE